ncbi:IS5 family transposase [Escherichia coli]|nr:IS5 family transposase [Escherichia coli]
MKDQITHLPDNADRSVAKQKFKITNWPTYNKALINRGSITFWLDDEAIQAWYESATPSSRGRPQRYSDLAITTVLVIKRVFRLTLRALRRALLIPFFSDERSATLPGLQLCQQAGKVG